MGSPLILYSRDMMSMFWEQKSLFLQIFEVARLWATSPSVFLISDWYGPCNLYLFINLRSFAQSLCLLCYVASYQAKIIYLEKGKYPSKLLKLLEDDQVEHQVESVVQGAKSSFVFFK